MDGELLFAPRQLALQAGESEYFKFYYHGPRDNRELYRVVRPKGVVAFTTLVQGSLPELHQAWQAVDERPHANRFLPPDEIEQSLNGVHYQHHIQFIGVVGNMLANKTGDKIIAVIITLVITD